MTKNLHGDSNQNTITLINEISQLFLNVANRRSLEANIEKQNLLKICTDVKVAEVIDELTVISFHILDAIGQYEPINTINIAQKTNIPKGTVSKNISKLISSELIIKNNIPGNRKESVFTLTATGKELFELHRKMHQRLEEQMIDFFKQYKEGDLQFIVQFLNDYINKSWAK